MTLMDAEQSRLEHEIAEFAEKITAGALEIETAEVQPALADRARL